VLNQVLGTSSCLAGTQGYLIERAAEFAHNRKQFTDKIYQYGAIQEKLARMSAEHYATESVAYLISQAGTATKTNY
jgi:very long chain acyl-CoA dehydrogenase